MVLEINKQVSNSLGTQKGQAVIYILFEYDRTLIEETKKLTGTRWIANPKWLGMCWIIPRTGKCLAWKAKQRFRMLFCRARPRSINWLWQHSCQHCSWRRTVQTQSELRHSYATHLHMAGTDLKLIQELFGHNAIKTTLRYIDVSKRTLENIKSPFDALTLKNE